MINENLLSANGYSLDCSNAESLDSSVKSSMGISGGISKVGNEIYYNSANNNRSDMYYGGDSEISPEMIQAGLATTTAVVSGLNQGRTTSSGCKRPLIRENFTNRGKWSSYKDCLAREERNKQRELEIAQAKAQAEALANMNRGGTGVPDYGDSSDKILGMPKGLAIGLGVVLGLSVAGFIVYKVVKAKKG